MGQNWDRESAFFGHAYFFPNLKILTPLSRKRCTGVGLHFKFLKKTLDFTAESVLRNKSPAQVKLLFLPIVKLAKMSHIHINIAGCFGCWILDWTWSSGSKFSLLYRRQRLYPPQIIWVCPDIWVFSVLHHRHCQTSESFSKSVNLNEERAVKQSRTVPKVCRTIRTRIANKQILPYWKFYFGS